MKSLFVFYINIISSVKKVETTIYIYIGWSVRLTCSMLNAPNRTWHDRRWKGEARNALYIMVLSRTSHKCIKYCMTNIRAQKAHKQTHSNLTKSYRAYMYISNIICETLRKRNQTTSHQTSPLLASAEKATAARQPLFPKEYLYEMPCSWPFCYFQSWCSPIDANIV